MTAYKYLLTELLWFCFCYTTSYTTNHEKELSENAIYYKRPTFSVKNSNVTFISPKYDAEGPTESDSLIDTGKAIAVICQADKINRGEYPTGFEGTINLAFEDFQSGFNIGQSAVFNLLGNDLYFAPNNTKLTTIPASFDVTGMISLGVYGTSRVNSYITNYYGIPTITAGDTARNNPTNNFIDPFRPENITFFEILDTQTYNSFNATMDVLNYFNWTLVGALYAANSYGYTRQANYMSFSAVADSPIFACEQIVNFYESGNLVDEVALNDFCNCVNGKNTIQIITLWMATFSAILTIESLRRQCSTADQWTFIVTNDYLTPASYDNSNGSLKNALVIRNNGPWNYQQFIDECEINSNEQAKKVAIPMINKYYRDAYKCIPDRDADLPNCSVQFAERTDPCKCLFNEFDIDPYSSRYLYSSDMVNTLAQAMGLIQNNCTFLDEKQSKFQAFEQDFCKLTAFTPEDLSFAMRYVDFIGLTGPINFPENILRRNDKLYYLYSVNNTIYDAILAGVMFANATKIDGSRVIFLNDKTPVSAIVPQNPGLNYGSIAAFFGISIIEIILCFIVLVTHIIYFNHPVIRKNSPYVSLCIICGITALAIGEMLFCLTKTNGICTVAMYIYRFGFFLMISGLLVKNYRIYRIFSNRSATAVFIPESTLLIVMFVITLLALTFITVFVAIFGYDAVLYESSYDKYYYYYMCGFQDVTVQKYFKFVIQLSQTILVILNTIMAWMTRKVNPAYSESKPLATFSLIIFAAMLLFVPLTLLINEGVDAAVLINVVEVEFFTIIVFSALILLFLPKLYYIYKAEIKTKKALKNQNNRENH